MPRPDLDYHHAVTGLGGHCPEQGGDDLYVDDTIGVIVIRSRNECNSGLSSGPIYEGFCDSKQLSFNDLEVETAL
jgi:hypothetical protein